MKLAIYILLFIPVFAAAQIDTIVSSNIQRTYMIQLPKKYCKDKDYPLILVLHGYHFENLGMPQYTGFDKFVEKNCIVAYPHGLKEKNGNNYFWNPGGGFSDINGGVDDVEFISNLIDTISCKYAVYSDSVFIAGHSLGGMMAYRLAMEISHKITAVANVSGSMIFDTIAPDNPVSILHIHGTNDLILPVEGYLYSTWYIPVDKVLKKWAEWNNCIFGPDTIINSEAFLYFTWSDENKKNKVVACFIKNQGHDWNEITNSGWVISENIWSFFTKGSLLNNED